ncbi:MAG: hypothetical protein QOD44_3454 [Solirubrobacteraceae bacterium]|jgi:hypothetical protein|nr:hypothetical protein [Solirubrobacteraceae bacterium]
MGRLAGIVAVTAILAAMGPARVGGHKAEPGPLRWDGAPRASAIAGGGGDRLLFGHVVNRSDHVMRLRSADVHVRDGDGDELRTSAAYADGFIAGVTLRGYGDEIYSGDAASTGPGSEVALRPGEAAPLTVSFTVAPGDGRPVAVDYGDGTLALE